MIKNKKDPKKVAAGRKGGKVSGGNFKRNRNRAVLAGQRSAWLRNNGKLEDYPVGLIDVTGEEIPLHDPKAEGRKA